MSDAELAVAGEPSKRDRLPPLSPKAVARAGWRMTPTQRGRYYASTVGWTAGAGIVTYFLTIFLLFQGVNIAAVGSLILIVKIIDAVDDLFFGYFIDRINPARLRLLRKIAGEGKYLPWYRLTYFLLPLSTVAFFAMPTGLSDPAKIAWFAVTYLLFDLSCTLSQVPMQSMIVTLTDRVTERDNILKTKGVLLIVVAVVSGISWQFMISEFVGWPVATVAIVSAGVCLVAMAPLAYRVKEHNTELKNLDAAREPRYTIREMLHTIRTNKYMLIILTSDALGGVAATSMTTGLFAAFFLFGNSMIMTLPVIIAFLPGLVLQFFADGIAHRMGKRNAIVTAGLLNAAGGLTIFFIGPDNVVLVIALMTFNALPGALTTVMRTFMIPDTIEYTRYKTGQDCAGIFFALESFVTKATTGVASALAVFVLGLGGWISVNASDFADLAAQNVTQPPSALTALWFTTALIPAIGALLSVLTLCFYKLRDQDAALMATCNSGEITREGCEARLSRSY